MFSEFQTTNDGVCILVLTGFTKLGFKKNLAGFWGGGTVLGFFIWTSDMLHTPDLKYGNGKWLTVEFIVNSFEEQCYFCIVLLYTQFHWK